MRTIIKGITIISFIVALFAIGGYYDTHYTKKDCTILSATETGIIIQDLQGHTWYYEAGGFHRGEHVTMKMHSNNTDGYVEDDIILAVVKCDC